MTSRMMRAFSRAAAERRGDAARVGQLPGHVLLDGLGLRLAGHVVDAADDEQRPPLLLERHVEIQQQRLIDVQDAGGVLRPLQVAAHPETVLGDARDHRPFSITQVSLLPPPWLELTTSEPLTRAVRVRPPGSTQVDLAADDVRPQIDVPRRRGRPRSRSGRWTASPPAGRCSCADWR